MQVALSIFFEGHSVPSKGQAQAQAQMQVTPSAHSSSAGSSLGSRMSCVRLFVYSGSDFIRVVLG